MKEIPPFQPPSSENPNDASNEREFENDLESLVPEGTLAKGELSYRGNELLDQAHKVLSEHKDFSLAKWDRIKRHAEFLLSKVLLSNETRAQKMYMEHEDIQKQEEEDEGFERSRDERDAKFSEFLKRQIQQLPNDTLHGVRISESLVDREEYYLLAGQLDSVHSREDFLTFVAGIRNIVAKRIEELTTMKENELKKNQEKKRFGLFKSKPASQADMELVARVEDEINHLKYDLEKLFQINEIPEDDDDMYGENNY